MNRDLKKKYKEIAKERAYLKARLNLVEIDYCKLRREVRKDTSLTIDQRTDFIHEIMKDEEAGTKEATETYIHKI